MNWHITVQNTLISLFFLAIFLLSILLFTPLYTSAQIVPGIENTIVFKISPTNPGPRESVTVSAESFSIDLDRATISWFVNDILKQQSIGGKIFRFDTDALGSSSKIDIVATTEGILSGSEQVIIRPIDIDILWQAHTSTYPLYRGKSEASVGSIIAIETVPHFVNSRGNKIKVSELVYSWRVDGKVIQRVSGKGQNTISVSQTKPLKSLSVSVEIESIDKALFGKRTLLIPIKNSHVLVYENNPLLGTLFNKTIKNIFSLVGQETKFTAYPFAMSLNKRNDTHINYSWRLNNKPITLGEDKGSITVSHTGSEEGEAEISVSIKNTVDFFQEGGVKFKVIFGSESSSSFGF